MAVQQRQRARRRKGRSDMALPWNLALQTTSQHITLVEGHWRNWRQGERYTNGKQANISPTHLHKTFDNFTAKGFLTQSVFNCNWPSTLIYQSQVCFAYIAIIVNFFLPCKYYILVNLLPTNAIDLHNIMKTLTKHHIFGMELGSPNYQFPHRTRWSL